MVVLGVRSAKAAFFNESKTLYLLFIRSAAEILGFLNDTGRLNPRHEEPRAEQRAVAASTVPKGDAVIAELAR